MTNNNFYNKNYYKKYEFGFRAEERLDHKRILELLELKIKDRVLEIGCGFGVLLSKIFSKEKLGIETNEVAIGECRKRELSVIKVDVEKGLPLKDSSFNIIIMNEVLEHLKKPEFVLKECFRVLSPGGRIIITTPVRSFFHHNLTESHFSEMTVKELRKLVEQSGFKILVHEVCGISFLYPLLENIFFKPFRFLRNILSRKERKGVQLIDCCHSFADKTILKPFSIYRRFFLSLATNQLILAQKE